MSLSWWRKAKRSEASRLRPRRRAAFRPFLEALEGRQLLASLTVSSTADSGAGTLRQALMDSNNQAGPNTITFSLAANSVIQLSTALPAITVPVTIDGTSATGAPQFVLDGSKIVGAADGLTVTAANTTIKGLAIINFASGAGINVSGSNDVIASDFIGLNLSNQAAANQNGIVQGSGGTNLTIGGTTTALRNVISGNTGDGVFLQGTNDLVEGNFIGINSSSAAIPNQTDGVLVMGGANTIGGTGTGAGNVLSGNGRFGIILSGSSATNNLVQGNMIGTDPAGTSALANTADGVALLAADNNTIGGTVTGAGNVISGNGRFGILDQDTTTTNNLIQGNKIGTDLSGTVAVGNASDGMVLMGASSTTIGGTAAGAGNVISGNGRFGIFLQGQTSTTGSTTHASNILVQANTIGLGVGGQGLGNADDGIALFPGATSNTIGGTVTGAGNLISGNKRFGVFLSGNTTSNNLIEGNKIGTDETGTFGQGNVLDGIYALLGPSGNTIGGTSAGAGNVISGNGRDGIYLTSASSNAILGNLIGTNITGTAKVINGGTAVCLENSTGTIVGGVATGAGNVIGGNSEGVVLIGTTTSTLVQGNMIGTDKNGTAALPNAVINDSAPAAGVHIVGGANSNTVGGSSTAARNVISGNAVSSPGSSQVNGDGVLIAGSGTNSNVVMGNFIGLDAAGSTILSNNNGVHITGGAANNTIGGASVPSGNAISGNSLNVALDSSQTTGNLLQGNRIGTNAAGTAAPLGSLPATGSGTGLSIGGGASSNTVGGSTTGARNIISANTNTGVSLFGAGTSGNVIEGNFIGTDATGSVALGNGHLADGVDITSGASNNTIGGTVTGEGNVISGNGGNGIAFPSPQGTPATLNLIQGNLIGVDVGGTVRLANGSNGVFIQGAANNTIGGTSTGAANVISGNNASGVVIQASGTVGGTTNGAGNIIQGNFIGTDRTGTLLLGNGNHGVYVTVNASNNLIGGTLTGAGNTIANNGGNGVLIGNDPPTDTVAAGTGNGVFSNSIFGNGRLGINLGPNNSTPLPNDSAGHVGPNNFQNFPVLASVTQSGTATTITGSFTNSSTPNSTIRIEFFANSGTQPADNHGQGRTFLGSLTATTDAQGRILNFSAVVATLPAGTTFISATASDQNNNTSEFSLNLAVT
jgi:titin